MARYRKVEPKMWRDEKFRQLSAMQPCGQALWVWLLTGPCTTNIPGVIVGTDQVMAAELRWPLRAFREAFAEASGKAMAKGDFDAGLVWLPNACRPGDDRNKPESPNVVRSWRDTWDELPNCRLKLHIWHTLKAFTEGLGAGFAKAFVEACRQPSPNQEQEQEQNQKQEQEQTEISSHPESTLGLFEDEPPAQVNDKRSRAKPTRAEPPAFLAIRQAYPKRTGSQRWEDALGSYRANLRAGHTAEQMHAGVLRYVAYCKAEGITGTKSVQQAATFLGKNKGFLEEWQPSPGKGELRQQRNIDATQEFLEQMRGGSDAAE